MYCFISQQIHEDTHSSAFRIRKSLQYIKRWRSTYIFGWYFVFCCTVQYIKRWRSTYIFGWYFVVLFDISKDGAAHIYLDGILLYCSIYQKMADAPILRQLLCTLLYLLDIRIYDINRQLVNVFHILLVLMDVTNDGSKHKLVYLVS